jgi:hypothetical protein
LIEKNAGTVHPRLGEQVPGNGGSGEIVGGHWLDGIKIRIKSKRRIRN